MVCWIPTRYDHKQHRVCGRAPRAIWGVQHSSLFQLTSGLSPATGEHAGKWITVCHLCPPHICFTSTVYPREETRRPNKEPRQHRRKRPTRRVSRGGPRAGFSTTTRALLDDRRASPQEGICVKDCQRSRGRGEGMSGGEGRRVSVENNRAFSKMEEGKIAGSI